MVALLLSACASPLPGDLDTGDVPANPTYTAHIAPLMATHCVRCHQHDGVVDHGVEVDTYEGIFGTRVRSTCVSVGTDVVDAHAHVLLPLGGQQDQPACGDWEPMSMPPGAQPHLTLAEQLTLARWVEQGGPQ